MLAVRNCWYVAVCSEAQGTSVKERGGGISRRPPTRPQLVKLNDAVNLQIELLSTMLTSVMWLIGILVILSSLAA